MPRHPHEEGAIAAGDFRCIVANPRRSDPTEKRDAALLCAIKVKRDQEHSILAGIYGRPSATRLRARAQTGLEFERGDVQ